MSESGDSEPADLVVIDGGNCRRATHPLTVTSPTPIVCLPEPVQTHVLQGMRPTCVNICVPDLSWGGVR
jgi:hypothetical protein